MDAVITYVNGADPIWRSEYENTVGKSILSKRFRDWGTLRYLIRGICEYMPYVENVFLVVSGKSQVPGWVNTSSLKVVTHEMFIPSRFLPTFNSNTIEMFLHRIPGIAEEFIYFNDDFFPVAPSSPEDFFKNGKIVMKPSCNILTLNMFKKICRNSDRLARRAAGVGGFSPFFLRPQHSCAPMLKSVFEEVHAKVSGEIDATASRKIRSEKDLTQYLFSDYAWLTGRTVGKRLSNKHFSLASSTPEAIEEFLSNPTCNFVCINDVKLSENKENAFREAIITSFRKRLPNPSKFEKLED